MSTEVVRLPSESTIDAAAAALRALCRSYGGERVALVVMADGRVAITVLDSQGYMLGVRYADTLPGGPLPTTGEAMVELFDERPKP